ERLLAVRPRVAAEMARPHSEEALLAAVVGDLVAVGAERLMASALGLPGTIERLVLWGADARTGTEDLALAAALRTLSPDAGRAVLLDAEPDLLVVTPEAVAVVDASVGRPGHAAARAARGEPVPAPRVADVQRVFGARAIALESEAVARTYPVARAAAVALLIAGTSTRASQVVALSTRVGDLLRPEANALQAWTDMAGVVAAATGDRLAFHPLTWVHIADALATHPVAATAVTRIRTHPVLAAPRGRA
ncbi:MAG: hypothetical protein LC640_08410, partial [Frankia sp.]|nr:hypothetical protein [Frankia sp.]